MYYSRFKKNKKKKTVVQLRETHRHCRDRFLIYYIVTAHIQLMHKGPYLISGNLVLLKKHAVQSYGYAADLYCICVL